MDLCFKQITPNFGAIVSGFNGISVISEAAEELNSMLDQFAILVFPRIELSESQQLDFARIFGEPSMRSRPATDRAEQFPYANYISLVTNVRKDGVPIGSLPDGEMWFHHDGCFIEEPYRSTILYALEVTSVGGATRFVDMRAVFKSLPKELIVKLKYLRGRHGFDYRTIAEKPSQQNLDLCHRMAVHPVIIEHPNTGEPALYVNPLCTFGFDQESVDQDQPQDLLAELFSKIESSPASFSHQWSKGDLVIWDNWSSCHARDNFPPGETRMLRRNTIKGQKLDAYFK